jgi:hypothetical protein
METPAAAAAAAAAPRMLLVFTSWWQERDMGKSVRREVEIAFDPQDCSCYVTLNRMRSHQYHLSHLMGKFGCVEACDLHVGAKINVLGRNVTLRQANLETVRWIESRANDLKRRQKALLDELESYGVDVVSLPSGKTCRGHDGGRDKPDRFRVAKPNANESLRTAMRDIAFLQNKVETFRPISPHERLVS